MKKSTVTVIIFAVLFTLLFVGMVYRDVVISNELNRINDVYNNLNELTGKVDILRSDFISQANRVGSLSSSVSRLEDFNTAQMKINKNIIDILTIWFG